MRTAVKALVIVVVLLVVGFFAASFIVDGATRRAVEDRTGDALGSPAQLDSARVSLFTGGFRLSNLNVNNPQGFDSPVLLRVTAADGDVRYGTLFADVVELPRLTISGIEATLERRNGRGNYDVVMASIGQSEQAPEEGRRYIIRELLLKDLVVTVDIGAAPGMSELTKFEVRIPEMRLTNIGTEMDRGVVLQDVAGTLFKAIVTAVIERAGDEIPGLVAGELTARLNELESISADVLEIAGERITERLRELDPGRLFRIPGRE